MAPLIDKKKFTETLQSWGAGIVRIADTANLAGIETEPGDLLDGFPRAVSIAVRLSDPIMDGIDNQPTPLYSSHYSRVNALLDDIAVRTTNLIQEAGGRAVPIPASLILDSEKWTSFISHKAVALSAGIGWQGKSLLLVTPEFGPRVRLVTILTDADLDPDFPVKNRCGKCNQCKDHCPAGAILGKNTVSHYTTRSEAVDLNRCVHQVRDVFGKLPNTTPLICGVCIKVCPWGSKTGKNLPKTALSAG
ncbi:4Fe-4S double cluster binding domain-containing protein [Desulfospira joergensenii]|uniref:4Fe-4S double cluster binding domain-containing protein n=1 Tax=Desulfospira joergensenii TaxID=53329 RepID=UPI0003B3C073|nr:4Fe-4S double cluster binding domain-containing protein [Desulfospira joergensenii]